MATIHKRNIILPIKYGGWWPAVRGGSNSQTQYSCYDNRHDKIVAVWYHPREGLIIIHYICSTQYNYLVVSYDYQERSSLLVYSIRFLLCMVGGGTLFQFYWLCQQYVFFSCDSIRLDSLRPVSELLRKTIVVIS